MKTYISIIFVSMFMATNILFAQQTANDSTGLPGDNFNLQGALQMFKDSKSLEEFEQKLNTLDNHINNLDLNGNDTIDYIRIVDKSEGTSHALVLQVAVNENESQDVAVIEIEKNGNESAVLQIFGDEELYGDSVFVEPVDQSDLKPGQKGPMSTVNDVKFVTVNVWLWPCVKFIYAPAYVTWASPWKWHYYPVWWKPVPPLKWRIYNNYCLPYHVLYHRVYVHRVIIAHKIYKPYRRTSVIVVNRYKPAHLQYKANKEKHFQKPVNNKQVQGNNKLVQGNKMQKTQKKQGGRKK